MIVSQLLNDDCAVANACDVVRHVETTSDILDCNDCNEISFRLGDARDHMQKSHSAHITGNDNNVFTRFLLPSVSPVSASGRLFAVLALKPWTTINFNQSIR